MILKQTFNGNRGKVMSEYERWRNTGESKIVLKARAADGGDERLVVRGPMQFTISKEDRARHSQEALTADVDFFRNGTFVPVVDAIETDEDADAATDDNPHLMTDSEFSSLLVGNGNTFKATLKKFTAEPALRRLEELAKHDEVKPARLKAVQERLGELGFETIESPRTVGVVS